MLRVGRVYFPQILLESSLDPVLEQDEKEPGRKAWPARARDTTPRGGGRDGSSQGPDPLWARPGEGGLHTHVLTDDAHVRV